MHIRTNHYGQTYIDKCRYLERPIKKTKPIFALQVGKSRNQHYTSKANHEVKKF